jgi:hypothetical protein
LQVEALEGVKDPIQFVQAVPSVALFHHASSSRDRAGENPDYPSLARSPIIWSALCYAQRPDGTGAEFSGTRALSFYTKSHHK